MGPNGLQVNSFTLGGKQFFDLFRGYFFCFFLGGGQCHGARGILAPKPGMEPVPPAAEAQKPNHWMPGKPQAVLYLKLGTSNIGWRPVRINLGPELEQAWKAPLRQQNKSKGRASLVAQWLRVCLPMQGTRVRALVSEDPTCRGATRPVSHNYWACASGACAPQQERPR